MGTTLCAEDRPHVGTRARKLSAGIRFVRDGGWPCMTREKEKMQIEPCKLGLCSWRKNRPLSRPVAVGPKKREIGLRFGLKVGSDNGPKMNLIQKWA